MITDHCDRPSLSDQLTKHHHQLCCHSHCPHCQHQSPSLLSSCHIKNQNHHHHCHHHRHHNLHPHEQPERHLSGGAGRKTHYNQTLLLFTCLGGQNYWHHHHQHQQQYHHCHIHSHQHHHNPNPRHHHLHHQIHFKL